MEKSGNRNYQEKSQKWVRMEAGKGREWMHGWIWRGYIRKRKGWSVVDGRKRKGWSAVDRRNRKGEKKMYALKEEEKMECGYWRIKSLMKSGYMEKTSGKNRSKDTRKGQEKDERMVSYEEEDFRRSRKGGESGNTEGREMDTSRYKEDLESRGE